MNHKTLDCGHESTPDGCAAGYAVRSDTGASVCYACAAAMTRDDMRRDGKTMLYLSAGPRPDGDPRIVTWDGTVISDDVLIVNPGWRDNFGGRRIAFRFTFDGAVWSGSGPGYGMYCRAKRTKLTALRA